MDFRIADTRQIPWLTSLYSQLHGFNFPDSRSYIPNCTVPCTAMNAPSPLFPRLIQARVAETLTDTPIVLIAGPRQAGKTTLVRQMADQGLRYLTLDDELTQLAAKEDPVGMIRSLDRAIIDEIQRAPQFLLAIKKNH